MPPIGSSVRTFAGEEELRSPAGDAIVDSVLPAMRTAGDAPLEPATQPSTLQERSAAVPEVGVLPAPASEQDHGPAVKRPPLVVESTLPLQPASAVPSVRVFAPRDLRRGNAKRDRGQQITKVVEETLRTLSPHLPEAHLESKPAVQVTREAVTPAQSEAIYASEEFHDQPEPKRTSVSSKPLTAEVPSPDNPFPIVERKIQEGEVQKASEPGPAPILKSAKNQSTEAKPPVEPAQDLQIFRPLVRPLAESPLTDMGRVEDRISAPKQSAQRGVFNTTDKRRRSQISIGRIDVQVNNLSQRESAAPTPARQPVYSNFLEARYLDRFFLKL